MKYFILLTIFATTAAFSDDVFKKIDNDTVNIISTVETNTTVTIKDLLGQRNYMNIKLNQLTNDYTNERDRLQHEIDLIDQQLVNIQAVGVGENIDIKSLPNSTISAKEDSGAGSLTGKSDLGILNP